MPEASLRRSSSIPSRHVSATSMTVKVRKPEDDAADRVKHLIRSARGKTQALVLTHDNPDPDSMASAYGIAAILEELAGVPTRIAYGGIVGRAENRAMVRILKLPVVPLARVTLSEYDYIVLVDTQPEFGNHSLVPHITPSAVVDHHPARASTYDADFADVGGDYGATASIVTSYVRASGVTMSHALATALFYGIKSDTRDLGRELGPMDVANCQWLFPSVDHFALSQIEHPSLSPEYFAAYHQALEKARRHGDSIVADLGKVYAPDIVAEMADRFLSLDGMRWSLAMGEYDHHLHVSIRTSDRRMNAGKMVRDVLSPLGGSAGGHGSMAGGRLPLPDDRPRRIQTLRRRVLRAFLTAFGAPPSGDPLV